MRLKQHISLCNLVRKRNGHAASRGPSEGVPCQMVLPKASDSILQLRNAMLDKFERILDYAQIRVWIVPKLRI